MTKYPKRLNGKGVRDANESSHSLLPLKGSAEVLKFMARFMIRNWGRGAKSGNKMQPEWYSRFL